MCWTRLRMVQVRMTTLPDIIATMPQVVIEPWTITNGWPGFHLYPRKHSGLAQADCGRRDAIDLGSFNFGCAKGAWPCPFLLDR
jgi:hypothetical protein